MNDTKHYPIPGETEVRDNNWREVVRGLAIQPRTMMEKREWESDAAALISSPEEFVSRANTWPSSLRNNRNSFYRLNRNSKSY